MRTEMMTRKNIVASDTYQTTLSKGHLNGFIVVSTNPDFGASKITIKRRNSQGPTTILASALPVDALARISDIERGFSYNTSRGLQKMLTELAATSSQVANVEAVTGELGLHMFFIDLGSIYLGSTSELDFSVAVDATLATGAYAVYRVTYAKTPDRMLQYDTSFDFEGTHHNVESIFFVYGNGSSIINVDDATLAQSGVLNDVTVQTEDGVDSLITDLQGAFAATCIFGEYSGTLDQKVTKIYQKPDALPTTVYCKVAFSGGVSGVYLVVRKIVFDAQATSNNTVTEAVKLAQRTAQLEATDPATARALRHAGEILPSGEIAAAAQNASSKM